MATLLYNVMTLYNHHVVYRHNGHHDIVDSNMITSITFQVHVTKRRAGILMVDLQGLAFNGLETGTGGLVGHTARSEAW